jgi:sugar phosphate permease
MLCNGSYSWKVSLVLNSQAEHSKSFPGMVSILVAFSGFWCLPNFPGNTGTYYFTAEESEMASYRATVSAGGISEDDEGDYWSGVRMALKDPFTWCFSTLHFFLIIAQSYKDFFPSVGIYLDVIIRY